MEITYKRTKNGRIFQCENCDDIHIEYKIININLSLEQFKIFSLRLISLDGEEWVNKKIKNKRKIFIPLYDKKIILILKKEELLELQSLLEQIDYKNSNSEFIKHYFSNK